MANRTADQKLARQVQRKTEASYSTCLQAVRVLPRELWRELREKVEAAQVVTLMVCDDEGCHNRVVVCDPEPDKTRTRCFACVYAIVFGG